MTESLGWSTEQRNESSLDIDRLPTQGVVEVVLAADRTVAEAVWACADRVAAAADLVVRTIQRGGRVHYIGSGTSGRMGVLDAVELLPTYGVGEEGVVGHLAGGMGAFSKAVEGAEDDAAAGAQVLAGAGPHDLVVGIAASGRTPYVRGALEHARANGLATVLVAANPQAPLAPLADVAVLVDTGPEVVTGSTRMKAATAQKMVLNAMSTAAMVRLGKTYSNLMIDMVPTNEKLRLRSVRMLVQATGADTEECARVLAEAQGSVRVALVALLSGRPVADAREALAQVHPDPDRAGDPSGIRTAVERLA